MSRTLFAALFTLALSACVSGPPDSDELDFNSPGDVVVPADVTESSESDLTGTPDVSTDSLSDRTGLTADPAAMEVAALTAVDGGTADAGVTVDARKSLAVTDKSIVSQFTLTQVMDQLAAQNGDGGTSGAMLFREMWDTQNPGPGLGLGPHCTDPRPDPDGGTAAFNKFPYECRPTEGAQAGTPTVPPTITASNYIALGLFNRFDLAPSNGATCGEYRIVFALNPSLGKGRNLIIFEASLPNPNPSLGQEGCRPVEKFWADLSANPSLTDRATRLRSFYFQGLSGFSPVVHLNNFGNNSGKRGQVRVNMFMEFHWVLREFKLTRTCAASGACTLRFVPSTVKVNPWGQLFNEKAGGLSDAMQTDFIAQVPTLARNDLNTFNYALSDKYNAGTSDEQFGQNDYLAAFRAGDDPVLGNDFRQSLQTKLTSIGSTLTPENIINRAQALSCAGCHALNPHNGQYPLGGGLTWPQSLGFTHISESSDPLDSTRFQISPALTSVFLPRRKVILEGFLNAPGEGAAFVSQTVPTSVTAGQPFTATITMKNTGTTSWTETNQYRLGTTRTSWGITRASLASTEMINRGGSKAFTLNCTAPTAPGTYVFQWQMVDDPGQFFGPLTPAVTITVR